MDRCRVPMVLSRNAITAYNANIQPNCSISTQEVIDKTKDFIANTAHATKEAAQSAKEQVASAVGLGDGRVSKRKINQRIRNAEEHAQADYVDRERTDSFAPGSYGEQIKKTDGEKVGEHRGPKQRV